MITLRPGNFGTLARAFHAAPAQAERQLARGLAANGARVAAALAAATPKRTGRTAGQWSFQMIGGGPEQAAVVENPSPLVPMLDQGTRAHVIAPRRAAALRFSVGGRRVFARRVFHPGTRALYFVERTLSAEAPRVARSLGAFLGHTARQWKGGG